MSAFILGNAHINAMLTLTAPRYPGDGLAYYWQDNMHPFGGHSAEIGQKLVDENYRSYNHRYREDNEPHTFRSSPCSKQYTLVGLIKACHCYRYQSCEHPDWNESEAYAIVSALLARAVRRLDGYEEAETWPIHDEQAPESAPLEIAASWPTA